MDSIKENLESLKTSQDNVKNNKVINFAYTMSSYNNNGSTDIPNADASELKVNTSVLAHGFSTQASSLTRKLVNHMFGRTSYNLNKVADNLAGLIDTLKNNIGVANGIALLDSDSKIAMTNIKKDEAYGVPTLDSDIKIPMNRLYADVADGVPTLDKNLKINTDRIPSGVLKIRGTWCPSTNLAYDYNSEDYVYHALTVDDSLYQTGDAYVVHFYVGQSNETQTCDIDAGFGGITCHLVCREGDIIFYNSYWRKLDVTDSVKLINGNSPNEEGSITINVGVKTINKTLPDTNGDFTVKASDILLSVNSDETCFDKRNINNVLFNDWNKHNLVYGGREMEDTPSEFMTKFRNSTVKDVFVGDYWVSEDTGCVYRIAEFGYNSRGIKGRYIIILSDYTIYSEFNLKDKGSNYINKANGITNTDFGKDAEKLFEGCIVTNWMYYNGSQVGHLFDVPSVNELTGQCVETILSSSTIFNASMLEHQFPLLRLNSSLIQSLTLENKSNVSYYTRDILEDCAFGDSTFNGTYMIDYCSIRNTYLPRIALSVSTSDYNYVRPYFCIA